MNRQQKRATLKKLNNPETLKGILKKHDAKQMRDMVKFKKSKLRKRGVALIVGLILFVVACYVFG